MEHLSMNTLRAILVACAALAVIVLLVFGHWLAAGVLSVGIAFHAALWVHLWRQRTGTGGGPGPEDA